MFGVKRPRDPSEPEGHDPKKQRPGQLPPSALRPDLDQSLRFRAPTLTPVDSSDEERDEDGDGDVALQKNLGPGRLPTLQLNPGHLNGGKPPWPNGDDLSPWQLNANTSNSSVLPSPIPHNLVHQSLSLSESATAPSHGYFPTPRSYPDDPVNSMEGVAFDQPPTIAPRLPSPISEDEDVSSRAGGRTPSDVEMIYDSTSTPLPFAESSGRPWTDSLVIPQAGRLSASISPKPSERPRKKPALVMGYRADCDKCRRRVPGHYSHINNDN
ncbi:hypothetical protein N7510_006014 [Penicillium lagena]|uniref:uncharacterized protein n=1 Tax=Penicillium lagena TaxID=94218 RepID=UPI00253F6C05|nr:uncharacterized protein N7510_006014 [Penicillium lagena]KAJ5612820.1 hypothetical protein N7510_006014 [Penicillium lagena]